MGLILTFLMLSMPSFANEEDSFVFESSGYKFESKIVGNTLSVTWYKSGFMNTHTSTMKSCWKKSIKREIASLGKKLLSPRGKHNYGRPIEVKWNKVQDSRYVFPREMDRLDKHFSFIFGMAQSAENKCGP